MILKEDSGDEVVVAELAELDAIAAAEAIDQETANQLFLRLQERHLRRRLAEDLGKLELQQRLLRSAKSPQLA